MQIRRWRIPRLPLLVLCFVAPPALARIGGGEHFDSGKSSNSNFDVGMVFELLFWLLLRKPQIGIPLIIVAAVVFYIWQRSRDGDASTRKALDRADAERRTIISASAVDGWVNALKARDPQFNLMALFDRTKQQFLELQEAWFKRNLSPVRRHLSDATFQRLVTQLKLMDEQGVRDAIANPRVLDLQIIGLEQSDSFDSIHIKVTAELNDAEIAATASDEAARQKALQTKPEQFTEVWTFVRKPGVQTKTEGDLSQGKCPNCGAPFSGGAANVCEFCNAIVNSGNYDWVLSEITQGSQYQPHPLLPEGFVKARQNDAALTTEALEDRASLLFWKWVEALSLSDPGRLAKVADPAFLSDLKRSIEQRDAQGARTFFIDCALGAANTQHLTQRDGNEFAAIELRWSARFSVASKEVAAPPVPTQPQRYVMVLQRAMGAQTAAGHGMSTNRCPNCAAALTDNGQPSCEFCGALLGSDGQAWVLHAFGTWEWWRAQGGQSVTSRAAPASHRVPDREERERLVYLMAAMASADGEVDDHERQLLELASTRWGVPWANVELALNAPANRLFERLLQKGSTEAEAFLRELVQVALADGKIDGKEKRMLEAAAAHVGLQGRLNEYLK